MLCTPADHPFGKVHIIPAQIQDCAEPLEGMSMSEGTIVKWPKPIGDRVEQGEPLVEIENAKAVNTLEAPVAGMVTQIVASSEDTIGTDGGVKYSTKTPKTLWTFQRGSEQSWQRTDDHGCDFRARVPRLFSPDVGGLPGRAGRSARRRLRLRHAGGGGAEP